MRKTLHPDWQEWFDAPKAKFAAMEAARAKYPDYEAFLASFEHSAPEGWIIRVFFHSESLHPKNEYHMIRLHVKRSDFSVMELPAADRW